jgi:uncharacterized protein YozE (UPF0346 family)
MKQMSGFRLFIKRFEKEYNAFGDFARDVKNDKNFPNNSGYGSISGYLEYRNASRQCMRTFRRMLEMYLNEGGN